MMRVEDSKVAAKKPNYANICLIIYTVGRYTVGRDLIIFNIEILVNNGVKYEHHIP